MGAMQPTIGPELKGGRYQCPQQERKITGSFAQSLEKKKTTVNPCFSNCQSQPHIGIVKDNNNPSMHIWVMLFKFSGSQA